MIKNIDRDNVINYGEDSVIVVNRKNPAGNIHCHKILNDEFASPELTAQLDNEYDICSVAKADSIRKAIQKTKIENHDALVLEFVDGMNLRDMLEKNAVGDIQDKIKFADKLSLAVSELHRENIIHGQLNPTNLLIEFITNKVVIIDFSIASRQNNTNVEQTFRKHSDIDSLRYISPEQTGRINRTIDVRSDLYSLGAVLYKLFTGKAPFETADPMELVYSHIAQTPVAPILINNDIPKVISNIILKLLSKNAEDRYQSAFGVHHDLAVCVNHMKNGAVPDDMALAGNDYSGKYFTQQKLYGRDEEINTLYAVFDKCVDGHQQLLMVSGYSGSGKSVLISEIQKPVAGKNGLFIKGKFDQMQIDSPYFAFRQAFGELIKYILISDQATQYKWKKAVKEAIGNAGKVLVDLMPGIETLIGPQPDVVDLKGVEAQSRFNYVLLNFLHATLDKDAPLVLFIDDLQWADVSSLNLISVIMNDKTLKHLMIIGSYRDNEVDGAHPLVKMAGELRNSDIMFDEIHLGDLSYSNVYGLVQDLLRTDQKNAHDLAEIIYSKTNGNAFYVHQFLKSVYDEQFLKFDFDKREWVWSKERIMDMNVSGNVVDFITSLIQKMPTDVIDLLTVASCLGNRFTRESVATLKGINEKTVEKILLQPLVDGLLILISGQYKFVHDRIQQAIYVLIPEEEKKAIHLKIGQVSLETIPEAERQEKIFDIVNHWNLGADLVTDKGVKHKLTELNLGAARRAVSSAAYPMALMYFEKSLELLNNDWASSYDLLLTAMCEAAESAYFCGEYPKVDLWVNEIVSHSKNLTDAAKGHEVSIKKLIAENKLIEAINLGLTVLDKTRVRFTMKPGQVKTVIELLKTKWILRGKTEGFYSQLPKMTDPETIAIMRILSDISSAAYFAAPELVPLLIFRMVRLSVSKGLSRKSPYSFAAYGFILSGYMGEIDNGITFGRIALDMVTKLKTDEVSGLIRTTNNVFLNHWRTPLHKTMNDLEDAFTSAMETGDNEWSTYAAQNMAYQLFVMGYPLNNLAKKLEHLDQQVEKFRQDLTLTRLRIFRQSIENLVGDREHPETLKGEIFDEDKIGMSEISVNNKVYFHNLYFQKSLIAQVFNMPDLALKFIETAGRFQESVRGSVLYPMYPFYHSLAITAYIIDGKHPASSAQMSALKKSITLLKKYEKLCRENYSYKRLLVEGEYSQIKGDNAHAKLCYDQALKDATANNILHDLAITWERAALFFENTKEEVLARFYMQNAYKAYRRWGAEGKLKQMLKRYPVLEGSSRYDTEDDKLAVKENKNENFIDLATVIKASAVISEEIVLSRLLKKLMQLLIENVGAQRGFFIMEKNDTRYIEAEINAATGEEKILRSIPVERSGLLAESVINYVYQTKEVVMLDDASRNILFSNDEFIRTHKSKSILCVPLINREKLQGIIYLSNDLISSAFTEQRLALLKILTGQIAISIENALFYSELENKVQQRTNELLIEKQKSDDLLLNILPKEVADELKNTGRSKARRYEQVSVMFTDFKSFTQHSEKLSPEELVGEVDLCFRKFDQIITKHGLEKIKTIGDAYLCVGGIPHDPESPVRLVKAALEMRDFIIGVQHERQSSDQLFFQMRIGINTGPVVAGIVGEKKFAYDIWGDTVNTAARMEQTGEIGMINISGVTYELVKDHFDCTHRGKVSAKNKGEIDMYFVEKVKNTAPALVAE